MTCTASPYCLQVPHVPSDMGRILAAPPCAVALRKSGSGLPSATATYTAMRKAAAAGVRPSQQVPRSPRRGTRSLVRRRSASTGHLVRHKASGEQQEKAPLQVGLLYCLAIGTGGGPCCMCCAARSALPAGAAGCCTRHQDSSRQSACAGHGELQPPSVLGNGVSRGVCCMHCGTGCPKRTAKVV